MSEHEKDYSLLRPFDLGAAKRGEAVCWYGDGKRLEYVGNSSSISTAGCFKWIEGDMAGYFETYPAAHIRMEPLCWVEGKPVYKGDVLYRPGINKGQVIADRVVESSVGHFLCFKGTAGSEFADNRYGAMTWTPPKVKRQIKLLAYLDSDTLVWMCEALPPSPSWKWVRVPSEDKLITIEE